MVKVKFKVRVIIRVIMEVYVMFPDVMEAKSHHKLKVQT